MDQREFLTIRGGSPAHGAVPAASAVVGPVPPAMLVPLHPSVAVGSPAPPPSPPCVVPPARIGTPPLVHPGAQTN